MNRKTSIRTIAAAIAGALAATVLAVSPVAAQDVPTCDGRPATIVGTPGDDVLIGTAGRDVIVGLAGADVIRAGAGGDIICAGPGRDRVLGGKGADQIWGGDDGDKLFGDTGSDRIFGDRGNDLLVGGNGDDVLDGGRGRRDRLRGRAGTAICTDPQAATSIDAVCRAGAPDPQEPEPEPTPTPTPEDEVAEVDNRGCTTEFGFVLCDVVYESGLSVRSRITVTAACRNAGGVRVETDSRSREYVAPGEQFLVTHFCDEEDAAVSIDPITWSSDPQPLNRIGIGSIPFSSRKLLPLETSVVSVGAIIDEFGFRTSTIRGQHTGDVMGDLTVTVAFYDSNGIRVEQDSRIQRDVVPGEVLEWRAFSDSEDGAVSVEVLEVELRP
jgi:hypothetical protein